MILTPVPSPQQNTTPNVSDSRQPAWFSSYDVQYIQQQMKNQTHRVVSNIKTLASVNNTTPPKRIVSRGGTMIGR